MGAQLRNAEWPWESGEEPMCPNPACGHGASMHNEGVCEATDCACSLGLVDVVEAARA